VISEIQFRSIIRYRRVLSSRRLWCGDGVEQASGRPRD